MAALRGNPRRFFTDGGRTSVSRTALLKRRSATPDYRFNSCAIRHFRIQIRAFSLAAQSSGLIIHRPRVRIPQGPPAFLVLRGMADDVQRCPHCGAKMVEYRHALNAPLLRALAKLYRHGRAVNLRELKLDRNEWDNFQKLKYWDFVYQVEVNGERKKGVWWLTRRGGAFVRGELSVQSGVWTYRGRRTRYDGQPVYVDDYLDAEWKQRPAYARESGRRFGS